MKGRVWLILLLLPPLAVLAALSFAGAYIAFSDIPVTGIVITTPSEGGMLLLDLAAYEGDVCLTAEVLPRGARNRGYSARVEPLSGSSGEVVSVAEDGTLIPLGTGVARLTVRSDDGGFTDAVTVGVWASAVTCAELRLAAEGGDMPADGAEISVGSAAFVSEISPAEVCPDVVWSVSPLSGQAEGAARIGMTTGEAEFYLPGRYLVTADITPAAERAERLSAVVEVAGGGLAVDGERGEKTVFVSAGERERTLYVSAEELPAVSFSEGAATVSPLGGGGYAVRVSAAGTLAGETLTVSAGGERVRVAFLEGAGVTLTGRYRDGEELLAKAGVAVTVAAEGTMPQGSRLEFEGDGVVVVPSGAMSARVSADEPCTGSVRAYLVTDEGRTLVAERAVRVVAGCTALAFEAQSETFGYAENMTVGGLSLGDGEFVSRGVTLALTAVREGRVLPADTGELEFIAEGAEASVEGTEGGALLFPREDGEVVVRAEWKYKEAFDCDISASLTLDTVKNAVNVYSEGDLRAAMDAGVPAVLQGDIMLGVELVGEDGSPLPGATQKQRELLGKMRVTADPTYALNTSGSVPEIYYALELTADIYGNGRKVSAERITALDAYVSSEACFAGPVDFVSLPGVASLPGQDNIVFLIRKDGVAVDNAVLIGGSDEAAAAGALRYKGTVLEIAADAEISRCRIRNGRTTVRIFGRTGVDRGSPVDAESERITVTLEECDISGAAEFALKIGTNRKLAGGSLHPSGEYAPRLSAEGVTFLPREDDNLESEIFRRNFLLTDVTVKGGRIGGAGLFAVGMECSFAGEMLDGDGLLGGLVSAAGWKGLAGTSYAAALRLAGAVELDNMKELDALDSSTLIETHGGGAMWDYLSLDIRDMIRKVCAVGGEEYSGLVGVREGKEFVHGGIAFYGGGKNYSVLDLSGYTGRELAEYSAGLSVLAEGEPAGSDLKLQGTMLPLAAGYEPFRFFVYRL